LAFGQGGARRHDHAPGAIERARHELQAEQSLALERAWQRELARLVGREAEALVIGRIAQKQNRAMATRSCRRKRVVHQRGSDPQLAVAAFYRERAEHKRRDAPGADVPQPHGSYQTASHHRREGKAFGGRTSVAQALAGAHMTVVAKAGIQQRFTRESVGSPLRTDRERSGFRSEGNGGLPQIGHGTSVLTSHGALTRLGKRCSVIATMEGRSRRAGSRLAKPRKGGQMW